MIVWLNGLSGSGKSTVGRILHRMIVPHNPGTVYLDGDFLRDVWGDRLGHTVDQRRINADRISRLCKMLDDQGVNVIASVMHMFPDWQDWYRENFHEYFEVFLDVPMDVLRARDSKNIYKAAEAGEMQNVVGIDIEFPRPTKANLVISAPEVLEPADEIAKRINSHLPTSWPSRISF